MPSNTNTANWPIQIVTIDKELEQVTLFNRSPDPVDLTGWHMCSITGGQSHPISGILGPFTVQTYTNTGGPIWNNSSSDPGALYNPAGQLVDYYPDRLCWRTPIQWLPVLQRRTLGPALAADRGTNRPSGSD